MVKDVRPTFSHHFLAELEKAGSLTAVITQNIDMLHQMAGSRRVVEMHGSYHSATCLACGRQHLELSYDWWRQAMTLASQAPVVTCPDCGGILSSASHFRNSNDGGNDPCMDGSRARNSRKSTYYSF